jgi:hypothetical protein
MIPVYVARKAMWLLLQIWHAAARKVFPVLKVWRVYDRFQVKQLHYETKVHMHLERFGWDRVKWC